MAYIRRSRKTYRKRKRVFKRRQYKRATRQFNGGSIRKPMGNSKKIFTRYVEKDLLLNGGVSGVPGVYVFSANGLYDPNITGTGHQPIGFDQYMTFFEHYTVIGAKIKVTFSNSNDSVYDNLVGISLQSSASALADSQQYIENGATKYTVINKTGNGPTIKTLTHQVSIAKFMGRSKILTEDDFRGTASANPDEQVYFHIFMGGFGSNDPSANGLMVQIDYITILTEPKVLSLS